MMKTPIRFRRAVVLGILLAVSGSAQQRSIQVGTVLDGPSDSDAALRVLVETEAVRLLGNRYHARFPPEKQLVGDWSVAKVRHNVDTLMADPEVDAIVVLGIVGPVHVSRRPEFPKPVVAAVVLDPETDAIPNEVRERPRTGGGNVERVRVSGVANLSYVAFDLDLPRQVEAFRQIAPFSRLAILTIEAVENELAGVRRSVVKELGAIGVEAVFLPVGRSIEPALDRLPADVDAVMLSPLSHLPEKEFKRLIQELHARKLPTYSLEGKRAVLRGAMAARRGDPNKLFLARRVALNLFHIVQGEEASALPIDFPIDEQPVLNLSSARAVGVDPTFGLMAEAEMVGESGPAPVRRISLAAVVREAAQVNLELASAQRRIEAGRELVKEARSNLLPQASLTSRGAWIDRDRAGQFQPQRQVVGTLGVQQILYSEQARAGYDIERQLQASRTEERLQLRLDIVLEAAQSYLEVLRSKTIEDIRKKNLSVTRSNLNFARARVDVGAAGRDEVLRWRSQMAQNLRSVIEAGAQRHRAEIAVNRILNRALEEPFATVEAGLGDPGLTVNFEVLRPFVESPGSFKLFRDFMTREAVEASPELRRLDVAIRAQQRSLQAARRVFYLPTVGLDAQVQQFKNGNGPEPVPAGGPNNTHWTISLQANLPLFQGGALRAQKTRAEIELDQVMIDRVSTRLLIDQRVRSALHRAGASFAGIELARKAAGSAQENLELVRASYREGVVDIVRVLDAQAQALSAELDAANAVFVHLMDLMESQRAVGRFDYFRSAGERDALIRRLEAFFQQKGGDNRGN